LLVRNQSHIYGYKINVVSDAASACKGTVSFYVAILNQHWHCG